jgi:anti-sigma-K factor RskA
LRAQRRGNSQQGKDFEMPVWGWILIAAAVVIVAVSIVGAVSASRRKRTGRLIRQSRTFIPEEQPELLATAIEDFLARTQ